MPCRGFRFDNFQNNVNVQARMILPSSPARSWRRMAVTRAGKTAPAHRPVFQSTVGPIRRLTPQPTDRGRADCPSLKGGVTKKDFIGSAVLSTTLFPLKGEVSNHKGIFDEQKCASSFWDEARSFFVLQRFGYGIAAPSDGPAYENSRGKAAACHRLSSLTGTKTARPQKQEKAGISTSLAFHWCRRGESNSHSVARTRP